jgi:protein disulfide-isomerase
MKIDGILLFSVVACCWVGALSATQAQSSEPGPATNPPPAKAQNEALVWTTDLQQALVHAKAEGKSVLLFFHGSDWCPPCVEMQHQVFDSAEFAQYARRKLVLVDVDFPEKTKQDAQLRQANLALKTRFNLSRDPGEGFPTIVLLNAAGETVFQETGYSGGGIVEVLPSLQRHTGASEKSAQTAGFKNLGLEEFAKMSADKQNVILDVRTAREFQAGHIQGAVNLDVTATDFEAKAVALDKNKVYLVHCASGIRSVKACEKLARLDFPSLYNLPGGFKAWVRAGKPVEK